MNRNISQNRIAILAVSQYVKNRNNIEIVAQISQYYRIVTFLPIPTPNEDTGPFTSTVCPDGTPLGI